MWVAVPLPLPVMFNYITLVGESTRRLSNPLGEIFTRPSAAAVATKKQGCACRKAMCFFDMLSNACPIKLVSFLN